MTYSVGMSYQKPNPNKRRAYVMRNSKVIELKKPSEVSEDPLAELLRNGARRLTAYAVGTELQGFSINILNSEMSEDTCR